MAINIFEGARRIGKLIAGIAIAGTIAYIILTPHRINATFEIAIPGTPPKRVAEIICPENSAVDWKDFQTQKGSNLSASFCFSAMRGDDGEWFIPVRYDSKTGNFWGGKRYTSEVSTYTSAVAKSYQLSPADEAWVNGEYWPAKYKQVREAGLGLFAGLATMWVLSVVVGWILRGFLGIPSGYDRKPDGQDDL